MCLDGNAITCFRLACGCSEVYVFYSCLCNSAVGAPVRDVKLDSKLRWHLRVPALSLKNTAMDAAVCLYDLVQQSMRHRPACSVRTRARHWQPHCGMACLPKAAAV